LSDIKSNIERVAQSLARRDESLDLKKNHFNTARGIFLDNLITLLENPEIDKISIYNAKDRSDKRFSVLQSFLIANPQSSIIDIYESIGEKTLFRDIQDLQSLIDWSHDKGYLIKDINNKYIWVEKNTGF
jgi:hypothetical protein